MRAPCDIGNGALAAAPAAAAPLPCLSSDNSDEHRVIPSGTDRKRAETTRRNIEHLQQLCGDATGVLTVTFAADLTTNEAQRKLANFKRRVIKENFGHSITVREFTARGRPHFHIVIDCKGDITTGYNWKLHDATTAWSKGGRKGAKPQGRLNRTPRLKALHAILNEKAPLYGLGRIELVPVKKPEAVGFYLGSYLAKSAEHKPEDAKGTRAVNYSHKCPRVLRGQWSGANPSGWVWRAKLGKWAAKHGCRSFAEIKALLGPHWAYHHRGAILSTELDYYPTAEHAWRDGVSVPPDSIDIRITRTRCTNPDEERSMPNFEFAPAPCVTAEHREERERLALAWLERHSDAPRDSSQAEGAESSQPAKRMFPPEEGSEGKRGSPLDAIPAGGGAQAATRQKRVYALQSRSVLEDRAKVPRDYYQGPLRLSANRR